MPERPGMEFGRKPGVARDVDEEGVGPRIENLGLAAADDGPGSPDARRAARR